MKTKIKGDKIVSQCERCKRIEMVSKDNRKIYQESLCILPKLPKVLCAGCRNKI